MTKPAKKKESQTNEHLRIINVASIDENDDNPRTVIDNVDDLKASIKANGLLQPIVVRGNQKNHHWKVIAGSRRFRACKELGIDAIPCIVIDADDDKAYELATAENIVRENMTAVDEANAVAKLFAQGKSRTEIGAMFGKTPRWAEGRRRIAELGGKAMEYLAAGKINLGHAEVLTMCRKEDVEKWLSTATFRSPEELKSAIMNEKPLLERAPFNAKKVCKDCENRSDCQRDLFGDVQNSYCLDRECFQKNVKKAAQKLRTDYIKQGFEEVPEDDVYSAQHGWGGYIPADSGAPCDQEEIEKLKANGAKPMFWVDEDDATHGLVYKGGRDEDDDSDDDEDDSDASDTSWNATMNRMGWDRRCKVRELASKAEKNIVADKLKAVFGNIRKDTKAFILAALDRCYTDEEGNDKSYLKDHYKAAEDFLDEVATALTEGWDGIDNDIREFLEMDSREEFERRENDALPEDWKPEDDKEDEENTDSDEE